MQRGGLSALDAALLVVVPPLGHPACVPDYSAAWHRCQLRLTQSPPALPLPLLMQIRESIKSLFPDRDCFTLVRPHCPTVCRSGLTASGPQLHYGLLQCGSHGCFRCLVSSTGLRCAPLFIAGAPRER